MLLLWQTNLEKHEEVILTQFTARIFECTTTQNQRNPELNQERERRPFVTWRKMTREV